MDSNRIQYGCCGWPRKKTTGRLTAFAHNSLEAWFRSCSFLFMGDLFVGSSRSSSMGVFSGCNLLVVGSVSTLSPFGRFQGPHLRPKPISMVLHRRLDGPLCPLMKSLVLKKEGYVMFVIGDRKLDMSRSVRCEISFCWLEEASMRCDDDDDDDDGDDDDDDDDDGDEDLFFSAGHLVTAQLRVAYCSWGSVKAVVTSSVRPSAIDCTINPPMLHLISPSSTPGLAKLK